MAITLSSIKEAADKKFAPTVIDLEDGKDPVVLVNPLRLDKKKRDSLGNMKDALEAEDAEMAEVLSDILLSAAKTPAQGKRLVAAADGDAAVLLTILNEWTGDSDAGEASTSGN